MSVLTETSSNTYIGNGATIAFATGFRFLANSEVRVTYWDKGANLAPIIWAEGLNYSLVGAGMDAGGTVTAVVPPAVDSYLTIERVVPMTQTVSFRTQGSFSPAVHEAALDESVFRDQQLARRISALETAGAVGSVGAGSGLSFGVDGVTLNVGAGPGLTSSADQVEVNFSADAPAPVDGTAATAGTAWAAARANHRHQATVAAPGAAGVVAGSAAAVGSGTALALANHVHEVLVGVPVSVTRAANDAGNAATFARSNHKHDVATAAPVAIGTANAAGNSASLAQADHVHDHGAQATPTHHAVATAAAAGFMAAADKAKLDGLAAEVVTEGDVATADATPTVIAEWTPDEGAAELVRVEVVGKEVAGSTVCAGYVLVALFKRQAGTTAQQGATAVVASIESHAELDAGVAVVASPKVTVRVTGRASSIKWHCRASRVRISAS